MELSAGKIISETSIGCFTFWSHCMTKELISVNA